MSNIEEAAKEIEEATCYSYGKHGINERDDIMAVLKENFAKVWEEAENATKVAIINGQEFPEYKKINLWKSKATNPYKLPEGGE